MDLGETCFGKTRVGSGMASGDSANHERPREQWIEILVPALVDDPTFGAHRNCSTRTKYGRGAARLSRASCHRFRANEVRLQLSVLVYNLGNL